MIEGMRLSLIAHQIAICVLTLWYQLKVSAEAQRVLVQRECLTQLVLHLLSSSHLCILPLKSDLEPIKKLRPRSNCLIRQFNHVHVCIASTGPLSKRRLRGGFPYGKERVAT